MIEWQYMELKTRAVRNAMEIYDAALRAVDPYQALLRHAEYIHALYRSGNFRRLLVVGCGKAVFPMVQAMEVIFSEEITAGCAITKYGHQSGQFSAQGTAGRMRIIEAGHPIPDENGLKATEEIISLLAGADDRTMAVCLISGGASALLVSPYGGITLDDKRKITELLLKSGADIYELNTLRKHISRVKGGRLAEIAYPARIVSLVLSDVIGDDIGVIASGPTAPDSTTFQDALMVVEKYGLIDKAPERVMKVLRNGARGAIPETPKEGNLVFKNVENIIIGSNGMALAAARQKAGEMGFCAEIVSTGLKGEARDAGRWLSSIAKERKGKYASGQRCLISGGETTVTVKSGGVGGRNMELALAFARDIDSVEGVTLLSAGTDGTDGPTDAAGAIVDGHTIERSKAAGLDPVAYLSNNDSYNFFKKTGELFITGPTGTNVMDIQIVIVE